MFQFNLKRSDIVTGVLVSQSCLKWSQSSALRSLIDSASSIRAGYTGKDVFFFTLYLSVPE